MKIRFHIVCYLLIFISSWFPVVSAQEVSIPDPNLASAVRNFLGLPQETSITQQMMQELTFLNAQDAQISDLTGLEHATNLELLNLKSNQISDISALADLTQLELLSLASNQIKDISPLSKLTNLSMLWLNENQISFVKSLSGLTQLRTLSLESNQIRIVTPLKSLTQLETLYLSSNQIMSIKPIIDLQNLEELYITDNPISDIFQVHQMIAKGVAVDFETSVPNESQVALTRVLFNEIRNASNDRSDWIELKNISNSDIPLTEWEIGILTRSGSSVSEEIDIVTFPDWTLPAGGILLITNTDPSATALLRGQNIKTPDIRRGAQHDYLVSDKLQLPRTPYLLILRSALDKNGTQEAVEDVAGSYFFDEQTADQPLTVGTAWQRFTISEVGYVGEAWEASGYKAGIGYQSTASKDTSPGTPGYSNNALVNRSALGQISISEVMFINQVRNRTVQQWIEIANNSSVEAVNITGWELKIEARHGKQNKYSIINFTDLNVLPKQTVLLVTGRTANTANIPDQRIYNLVEHHLASILFTFGSNMLSPDGFFLQLSTPDGNVVDTVGNLDGDSQTQDAPVWDLPSGITDSGARSSIFRHYHRTTRTPLVGTEATSWRSATEVTIGKSTYYGNQTDVGNPGYTFGGVLPVDLSYFRAERTTEGVIIKWTTESEVDNAGFYIYRSLTKDGEFRVVNPRMIQGAGTTGERNAYAWTDTTAKPNTVYYYRIEDVSFAGVREQLATVRTRGLVSASGKLTTRWAGMKRR